MPQQRLQTVEIYFQNQRSICQNYRALLQFYGLHNGSSEQLIRLTIYRVRIAVCLLNATTT